MQLLVDIPYNFVKLILKKRSLLHAEIVAIQFFGLDGGDKVRLLRINAGTEGEASGLFLYNNQSINSTTITIHEVIECIEILA